MNINHQLILNGGDDMIHLFKKGTNQRTLILFHGSGGNEHDLLSIASIIDKDANILSLRGPISEYGVYRFYKRKSLHEIDYDSLVDETHNLRDEIDSLVKQYRLDRNKVVAIGYSIGANMIASLLFHYEKTFEKAILFHPMVPIRNIDLANLAQTKVFITAGHFDQMMPEHEVFELTQMFESANADVEVFWSDYGHQLSKEETLAANRWYEEE